MTGNNTYTSNAIVVQETLNIRKSITPNIRIDQNDILIINPETKIGTLNFDGTINIKTVYITWELLKIKEQELS